MRAVVLTAVREVRIQDIPEPSCGENEVIIQVGAGGICGSDMHAYRGDHPFRKPPVVMGHEVAGRVVEVGRSVHSVAVGYDVAVEPQIACGLCDMCLKGLANLCRAARRPGLGWGGTFAEYIVAPEHVTYRLAPNISHEEGALIEPAAVALRACRRGGTRLGERVAVLGGGPIGVLIGCLCRQNGATSVTITDVKQFNLAFARGLGFDDVVDAGKDDVVEQVNTSTAGRGVDVVFVTSPSTDSLIDAVKLVRPGGTVVQVAIQGQPIPIDVTSAVLKEASLCATLTYTAEDFEATTALVNGGSLDLAPFVTNRYTMDDAASAFRDIENGMERMKVTLTTPWLST